MDFFKTDYNNNYAQPFNQKKDVPFMQWGQGTASTNVDVGIQGNKPEFGYPVNPAIGSYQPGSSNMGQGKQLTLPEKMGAWSPVVGMGLDVAKVGLGIYNATQQKKMNDFMKSYYGNQMAMQKADFTNAARSTNQAIESQQRSRLSGSGVAADSEEMKQGLADTMSKWGVQETY